MDWKNASNQQALLELLLLRSLPLRETQKSSFEFLLEGGFFLEGQGRAKTLKPGKETSLVKLLDNVWPKWKDVRDQLEAHGLKPNYDGFKRFAQKEQAQRQVDISGRRFLHEKTAQALFGAHSKAQLSNDLVLEEDLLLTKDDSLRLRPCSGLHLVSDFGTIDAFAHAAANGGEIHITERAFLTGTRFRAASKPFVLLVENLGAFLDMPRPEGFLLVHCAGWNTKLPKMFLSELPKTGIGLFGDLDPVGSKIYWHLKEAIPDLIWFVPDLYLNREPIPFARKRKRDCNAWPKDTRLPAESPAWLKERCLDTQRWYEQESIVCEPELNGLLTLWAGQVTDSTLGP